ncbi:polysaccharide biosynthesis protein [Phocaeicola sp.]
MALVILVGLYSSRVVLNALGVEDYGIYNVAGSVVAMFAFLNGALGGSSSRFITIELGKGSENALSGLMRCFVTTKTIHGITALVIVIIAESIGLWLLYNKCEIPTERMNAALWVYQISVATAVLSITLVPFQALIIAHEHMAVYAYIGIIDAVLKLFICYLIQVSLIDKLIFYALMIFVVQFLLYLFNRMYCKLHFKECVAGYTFNKEYFKPILGFTGWNLLGSFSYMAITHAATVMISIFFGPTLVTARAISGQVKNHVINFIINFRTAVNPQILKRYASGEVESSKSLLFLSTNVSFYLMLVITLPLLFETELVLKLWLKIVPPYTVEFLRITLLEVLFIVYDVSFYMIFQATGRLKENALICPAMDIVAFAIVFVIYQIGGSVLSIAWALLMLTIVQGMIVKPWLAVCFHGYKWKEFISIFVRNGVVLFCSLIFPLPIVYFCGDTLFSSFLIVLTSVVSVLVLAYLFGFDKATQKSFNVIVTTFVNKIVRK